MKSRGGRFEATAGVTQTRNTNGRGSGRRGKLGYFGQAHRGL